MEIRKKQKFWKDITDAKIIEAYRQNSNIEQILGSLEFCIESRNAKQLRKRLEVLELSYDDKIQIQRPWKDVWEDISDSKIIEAYNNPNIVSILRSLDRPTNSRDLKQLSKRLEALELSYNDKLNVRSKEYKYSDDILFKVNSIGRRSVKKRYIELTGNHSCSLCGQEPMWNEKPLGMILDHINGINNDNNFDYKNPKNPSFSNLRLVCPNCDTQLDTSKGKNARKYKMPSKEVLIDWISRDTATEIAKQRDIKCHRTIMSWCKHYHLDYKSIRKNAKLV